MKISIEEFLKTGKFGPFGIGSQKDFVISTLGEPDCDTDLGETGSILLYAWYELFFNHDSELNSIQNDNYDPCDKQTYSYKNEKFEIDSWFLNGVENQSINDISEVLSSKGMKYEIIDYYGRHAIKLKSGVVVDFDEEENERGINALMGIRYWPEIRT